jgi:metacaspase-1
MAKKAVLIGVNRYRMPGADLRGCVNDVKNMRTLLTSRYGFKAADISVLTDFAATKKAIETAIRSLIRGARSGDVVLVHFSGHGSNVPDNDGDEADKRDEILCPSDLDWKKPLRDDWLRTTFDSLRTGVSLTVVTDCCHSGTITRAVQPPDARIKERYLPSPADLVRPRNPAAPSEARPGPPSASRVRPPARRRMSWQWPRCPRCSSPAAGTSRRPPTPGSRAATTAP